jgi:localization factor PodJL
MSDPVDLIKPWSIKAVATRTQGIATAAARREGLTVGQWLEKRIDEWEGQGSPVAAVSGPLPAVNLGELAQAMEAARALANDAKVPVPPQLAKDGLSMVRLAIRQARGLPPPGRRRDKPDQAAIEG